MNGPTRRPPRRFRPFRWLLIALVVLLFAPVALLALLRFVDPPVTAFMLAERVAMWTGAEPSVPLRHEWVDYERIAPPMRLAVVAAEDQKFPVHHGFDIDSIEAAFENWMEGGRLRGASTISQQVARNLFLWRGRHFVRKGLEAWLTLWLELLWDKRRILEVYLNVAELGHGVYGVEAAAWHHFDRPAAALTARQATLLAAVLPSPRKRNAGRPSGTVEERAAWIARQMRNLGEDYLQGL